MEQAIRRTWQFDQPPHEVWDYLTTPALIAQWLGKTDFQPIVGHRFRFTSPYGNDSLCEVLEVQPFSRLAYTWQKKSAKDGVPFRSTVRWTLVPKDGGTELQLVHDGFAALEDVTGHEQGWSICLRQMVDLMQATL